MYSSGPRAESCGKPKGMTTQWDRADPKIMQEGSHARKSVANQTPYQISHKRLTDGK